MATGMLSMLQQYNPTANLSQQTYTADERAVDPAKETVRGQVTDMISKDDPLMQRAAARGTMGAASRGLVNSSLAQGAAMTAVLDKATEIGKADADIYNQRTLANMGAQNEQRQFNAGENNKLVGQGLGIASQFAMQKDQQSFTADQTIAQQNFTAAQSNLDRAQQVALADKSIDAQKALQAAQQAFDGAQSELNRVNQRYLQTSEQQFTGQQNQLDRTQQVTLMQAQQDFQAAQANLDRAQQVALADKSIAAQQSLAQAQMAFQGAQAALDRANQMAVMSAQQGFQSAENAADRAQQVTLADKQLASQQAILTAQQNFASSQAELDRAQQVALSDKSLAAQQALLQAQQDFAKSQAELDRTQQSTLSGNQIQAQKDILTSQQGFAEMQSKLDREQQTNLLKLQETMNNTAVSKSFAATTAQNTMNAINAIQLDPNLTPEQKKAAVDNVIGSANSTMQWGSTFYDTALPTVAGPGQNPGMVTPYELARGVQTLPIDQPTPATPATPATSQGLINGANVGPSGQPMTFDPTYGLWVDPLYGLVTGDLGGGFGASSASSSPSANNSQ